MHFPKFWARGESTAMVARNPQTGEPRPFQCWGWSDLSVDEARQVGAQRAARLAARIRGGEKLDRYSYGAPFREKVEARWQLEGDDSDPWVIVSRNAYGCRVLNARDVFFADIDAPEVEHFWKAIFLGLIGRGEKRRAEALERRREWESEACEHIKKVLAVEGASGRVYRTYGGLRCLLTHRPFDPVDERTLSLLQRLGSDPLYVRLCSTRGCFRARLTPKPWRCGVPALDVEYPWETEEAKGRVDSWLSTYQEVHSRYATCELVTTFGTGKPGERMAALIEHHDRETGVDSGRPLA
ncbi:MAG: hypothetical protein AAGM22_18935 [Acidobacteriota bacterium]